MATQPKKAGLSLYADLLEPEKSKTSSATISSAPVKYDVKPGVGGDEDGGGAKKKDASLKFQPIKRPQVAQKAKAKPPGAASSSSLHKFSSSSVTASVNASSPEKQQQQIPTSATQQPSVHQSNIEDWIGDDDDYYYQDNKPKHERGGKRKKKKNKPQERTWDWDDIYDPTMPNNYADYKGSEEQAREIRDWKARLYYHQLKEAKKARKDGAMGSDEEESRPRPMNSMFAPPSNLNFAPPSFEEDVRPSRMDEDDDDYYPSNNLRSNDREPASYDTPPSFVRPSVPEDATGEDAYMRRMKMGGASASASPAPVPPPPEPVTEESIPTPVPPAKAPEVDLDSKRAEAAAKIAAFKARLAGQASRPAAPDSAQLKSEIQQPPPPPPPLPPPPPPEEVDNATFSSAPVRYNVPSLAADEDTTMDTSNGHDASTPPGEQERSSRPGQKGFAERLLKRYGWERGQGLGASGEGITTAIVAKAEKRKKRPDFEGGRWAVPANMGKIVGGKKRKIDPTANDSNQDSEDGVPMSEVVKFAGMLDGLDVQKEIEEKNLMQEIGEEMQSQYGNVERVFIWREEMGGGNEVFVKFTSPASAVRAVQGMDGAEFAGNEVKAGFWETDRFEQGKYA